MAKFRYLARDKQGDTISGIMHAVDEDDLYRKLKEQDKYLIDTEYTHLRPHDTDSYLV